MHVDVPPMAPAPPTPAPRSPIIPPPKPEVSPAPARPRRWVRFAATVAAVLGLSVLAVVVARSLRPAAPVNELAVSGRLEGYQSDLGAKVGGRVVWVAVREGALVHPGQVLVQLDNAEARAQTAAAAAAVSAAQDRARQSQATLAVLASQIDETALGGKQAAADSSGRVAQARANVAAVQAQAAQAAAVLAQVQANLVLATADRTRYDALSRTGDISLQRAQEADAAYRIAGDTVNAQRAALAAAHRDSSAAAAALDAARSTAYNTPIHAAQVVTLKRQQHQAIAQIDAALADARQARALQAQSEAALADLTIRALTNGTVIARAVEPGMVVAPGRTLLSVVDLDHVYLRGYVPEGEIGRVRVGQSARLYLDSDRARPLKARVSEIDAQASFTPENVYFQQDRVQQVFGVKLDVRSPRGFAKPGMPADAAIDLGPA